jgi:glycosyltransferase involved in cell wall biosynthesis
MKVSVVVPIYNEEENILLLHEKLRNAMEKLKIPYELIFVDDGSKDKSFSLLRELQKNDKSVVVISFRKNFGQTAAFSAGFDHATGDVVVTMDGDLQNDPEDIGKLVAMMDEYDIVSGWRKDRKDPFLSRRLPSQIANWLISNVTGVFLHDYGCSLKAYKKEVLDNIKLYGEMHRFIPAVASFYGVKIAEVVTTHHPRIYGKSKYGISRTFKVVLDLIMVKFFQSFYTKPLRAFGPIGLLSFFAGVMFAVKLSMEKFLYHRDIGGRPLLILSVLLIIVGIQLVVMGLLGEFLVRIYFETQKKPIYHTKEILRNKETS